MAADWPHNAPEPDDRSPETSERGAWTDTRQETSRAVVDGSLEALGLEGHEALIVAHDDARHATAKLGNSKLRLSRWAEGYEREQGRCSAGVRVKEQRAAAGGRGGGSPGRFTARFRPRGNAARTGAAGAGADRRGASGAGVEGSAAG